MHKNPRRSGDFFKQHAFKHNHSPRLFPLLQKALAVLVGRLAP